MQRSPLSCGMVCLIVPSRSSSTVPLAVPNIRIKTEQQWRIQLDYIINFKIETCVQRSVVSGSPLRGLNHLYVFGAVELTSIVVFQLNIASFRTTEILVLINTRSPTLILWWGTIIDCAQHFLIQLLIVDNCVCYNAVNSF